MFNYWLIGVKNKTGVTHSACLKVKAIPGQTLTYEETGDTYRVLRCKEGGPGAFGEVRLVEVRAGK
jgi:hypothetical protein